MLFNLYLNDLAVKLKSLGCGIDIDGEVVPIILCTDDIALLAENEQDLQQLLNVLNEWCKECDMVTNLEKSNVVHFRNSSVPRTDCEFHIGNLDNNKVQVVDRYRYLGIVLNEFLDFSVTVRVVADVAHCALGRLLISKDKIQGGIRCLQNCTMRWCNPLSTTVWPSGVTRSFLVSMQSRIEHAGIF